MTEYEFDHFDSETAAEFDQLQAEALISLRTCRSFLLVTIDAHGAAQGNWGARDDDKTFLKNFSSSVSDLIHAD